MAATGRAGEIFADARLLSEAAVERLEAGDIRDAAEKAWGATKRATDALILQVHNPEPTGTSQTSSGIRALGQESEAHASLGTRYAIIARYLHGDCFYDGQCEPEDYIAELIRNTANYVRDAERLA